MAKFDLIIVGGGLAGASLAVALRSSPLKIALIENQASRTGSRTSAQEWDSRIYAISPINQQFLEHIGCWQHLDQARLTPIAEMDIRGDQNGRLQFSAAECGTPNLGWIVESSLIANELWETVKRQANVTLITQDPPTNLRFQTHVAEIQLSSGQTHSAQLIVGADGRDSWVRSNSGLIEEDIPYPQSGLIANFHTEHPHHQVAHQWFDKNGVLAYLPLPGNRISIVWSTPHLQAEALCKLAQENPASFCERIADAGHHTLGQLELITPPAAFPLRLIKVPQTVAHRIALIGDAAHGIHPLSGHGINLGFQDARVLADLLLSAPAWQDIGEHPWLQRYQRARKEEVLLTQTTTDLLQRLFNTNLPHFPGLLATVRNAGLNLTNALPPVKNLLVQYALGNRPAFFL